jgi:hypothetical protein
MGLLIVIIVFALGCWTLFATFRRLRRFHAGCAWWSTYICLALSGVILGYWLAFQFEYQVSPEFRFASFPIPLCFFHLENGQWVDFITPEIVMYPGLLANIVAITAIVVLPIMIASLLLHRQCHKNDIGV